MYNIPSVSVCEISVVPRRHCTLVGGYTGHTELCSDCERLSNSDPLHGRFLEGGYLPYWIGSRTDIWSSQGAPPTFPSGWVASYIPENQISGRYVRVAHRRGTYTVLSFFAFECLIRYREDRSFMRRISTYLRLLLYLDTHPPRGIRVGWRGLVAIMDA